MLGDCSSLFCCEVVIVDECDDLTKVWTTTYVFVRDWILYRVVGIRQS